MIYPESTIKSNNIIKKKTETNKNNNFVEDIQTFQKHNFYKIFKYIRHKYPSFLLFIHICISKYVFICKQTIHSDKNTTSFIISYKNNSHIPNIQFWIYIIVISLICFTWEFVYKFLRYKRKNKISKKIIIHSLFSSFISILLLISTMFYKDDNKVFDCFLSYNKIASNLMFVISYMILIIYSIGEHYCLYK